MSETKPERQVALVITIVIIEFISGFTQSYYEPLIPTLRTELQVSASTVSLFNTIPGAIAALLTPLFTRLGDIYGYRRILRWVIFAVFLSTVGIYVAVALGSWTLVLLARVLQGAISVWLPLHIALVNANRKGESATKAVSWVLATLALGTVVGSLFAGFFHDLVGNITLTVAVVPVLGLIPLALVLFVMPEFVSGAERHIDGWGFVGLAVVMLLAIGGLLQIAGGGLTSVIGVLFLIATGLVGWWWYRFEAKQEHPAVEVKVLFSRDLGPLYLAAIAFGAVFYGFLSPLATFLASDPTDGFGFGYSSTQISLVNTAILILTVVAALLIPTIVIRFGERQGLGAGFMLAAAGFILWLIWPSSTAALVAFILLVGFGLGVVSAAIPVIIPKRSPLQLRGIAVGLFNSSQNLGGAFGGSLFLSLLTVGQTSSGDVTYTGYATVWVTSAIILGLGLVISIFLGKPNPAVIIESAGKDYVPNNSGEAEEVGN